MNADEFIRPVDVLQPSKYTAVIAYCKKISLSWQGATVFDSLIVVLSVELGGRDSSSYFVVFVIRTLHVRQSAINVKMNENMIIIATIVYCAFTYLPYTLLLVPSIILTDQP